MHGGRIVHTADYIRGVVTRYNVKTISDMGAGDGGLLSLLASLPIPSWGYDLQPENVAGAEGRGVNVTLRDVLLEEVEWGDLTLCTEMLEHLVDPHAFVRKVADHSPLIVASSPNGETPQIHYEFHLWGFDMAGYRALIEQGGFDVVYHKVIPGAQLIFGVQQ